MDSSRTRRDMCFRAGRTIGRILGPVRCEANRSFLTHAHAVDPSRAVSLQHNPAATNALSGQGFDCAPSGCVFVGLGSEDG